MQQGFHPQQVGPARPHPPARKKGMNGCLIAFLVFLGLAVAGGLGVGIYLYVEFKEFVGATGEMAELMLDAGRTPGAEAMRKRGCQKAFALETSKFAKVAQRFEDEIARREGRAAKPVSLADAGWVLSCDVTINPLTPADVAKAFIDAQKPSTPIIVTLKNAFDTRSERFSAAGVSLGPTDTPEVPEAAK